MTDWPFSIVLLIPAALQDRANRLSCALGYDELPGNTYSVPLSADGSEPATHYGCRSQAKQEFIDILEGAASGSLPDGLDLAAFDLTPTDVAPIMGALIWDARPADQMEGHFDAVTAAHGLQRVVTDKDVDHPLP